MRITRFLFLYLCVILLSGTGALAQALKPTGYFLQDTIKIGEPIKYTLTFRYPAELEVIFPSEEQSFAPFEYIERNFSPTRTDSTTSYDSVVYTLMTFELDSLQTLALPVYIIGADREGNADSTAIYANMDSVYLHQLITQMPDSVDLKENTAYLDIPLQFNYPYLLIGLGVLATLALIIYLVFGDRIRKQWKLRRLRKDYKNFSGQFAESIARLEQTPDKHHSEETLVVWKRYMERLESAPYTKMTTKEIVKLPSEQTLTDDLKAIDRSIYGHHLNGELIGHFKHLEQHTHQRYEQRYRDIQHGRSNS
uniref:Protein BatD n=1 Tax=Roseihalotalea indica TaxID=2867963 RepID=A0AA49JJ90_9BACT|nr:hypothetical protein K4G66_10220 [Tunicatimonas sp. TK19036]